MRLVVKRFMMRGARYQWYLGLVGSRLVIYVLSQWGFRIMYRRLYQKKGLISLYKWFHSKVLLYTGTLLN